MNEERMLRISLIGSILGLIALYFIVLNISSVHVKIGEVTGNLIGSVVEVEGEVKDFYEHKNGHFFFNLKDDTGEIRVAIWENVVEELRLSGVNISEIRNGARMEITGTVELYRGELELIPLRSQVKIID
ncbi:MAG: exodeoxyribonuclease VII large subunit [Candidatus Aenigmarchaeota archaeon]|nr:exodeoxyribonuclease VII large subunit [Candidatus Aenigmarchaeota archaeon]